MAEHTNIPRVRLLPGREKLSRSFHPWVYSGALDEASLKNSSLGPGHETSQALPSVAAVCDSTGAFIAYGQYNPKSKIRLRLFEWDESRIPNEDWLRAALAGAFAARAEMMVGNTVLRLVFGDADRLPGIVVDRMGDLLVIQSETEGSDSWIPILGPLVAPVAEEAGITTGAVLEKSDSDGRRLEGLPQRSTVLFGTVPPEPLEVVENGLRFAVDALGQKTGFYPDQRDNRALVARYAKGRAVLDLFCYSGGFSVHARAAGALSLTLVDSSADALKLARKNLELNKAAPANAETETYIEGDVFQVLRRLREESGDRPTRNAASADIAGSVRFDLIILDPPKLAPNRASLDRALSAYKDLNFQALRLLGPGGLLASFSCSGAVSPEDLRRVISFAAKDAGRQVEILHYLFQAPCHPVPLAYPEALYLKGFLLRVR